MSIDAQLKQSLSMLMNNLTTAISLGEESKIVQIYQRIGAIPRNIIIEFIKETYATGPIAEKLKPLQEDNGVPIEQLSINQLAYWLVVLHTRYLKMKQNQAIVTVYDVENATSFSQIQASPADVLREYIDRIPALRRKNPKYMLLDKPDLEKIVWNHLKSITKVPLDDSDAPYECSSYTIEQTIAVRGPKPELLLGQCGRAKLIEYATANGIPCPDSMSDYELSTKITQFVVAKTLTIKPEISKDTIYKDPKGFLTTQVVIPSSLKGNRFAFLFNRNRQVAK